MFAWRRLQCDFHETCQISQMANRPINIRLQSMRDDADIPHTLAPTMRSYQLVKLSVEP